MNKLKVLRFLLIVSLLIGSMTGCGSIVKTGDKILSQYDTGVKLYNNAQIAYANYQLAKDVSLSKIATIFNTMNVYVQADREKAQKYRAGYEKAVVDATKPVPTANNGQVDLAKAQASGQLPPDWVNGGFAVVVNSVVEAPVNTIPESVVNNAMSIQTGAFDYLDSNGRDWNAAAGAYNTWRQSVKEGRIIADVAAHFGVSTLPDSLPLYSSATGPGLVVPTTAP
jgi:hypothetical protein